MKVLIETGVAEAGWEEKPLQVESYSVSLSDDGHFIEIIPAWEGRPLMRIPKEVFYGFGH